MCHLDLKPENILLTAQLIPMISDFGIASTSITSTHCKSRNGTAGYAAPEIFLASAYSGLAADVYSFGVLAFEVLSGVRPFGHVDDPSQVNDLVVRGERPSLVSVSASVLASAWSLSVVDLIDKCWAPDPVARPLISQVYDALDGCIEEILGAEGGKGDLPRSCVFRCRHAIACTSCVRSLIGKPCPICRSLVNGLVLIRPPLVRNTFLGSDMIHL